MSFLGCLIGNLCFHGHFIRAEEDEVVANCRTVVLHFVVLPKNMSWIQRSSVLYGGKPTSIKLGTPRFGMV